ncbi:MAG: tetratricopeptide repeat protein [Anaerolineae bacterium]|uniref:tetratricopeptide repeat protein n=1 Tax=Candidatus Amarolinea dominans TaxID=3140696 RepID=UPI00313710C5|nr:tetratricopeptide repeat protein [Anaerolineae bacterium]
MGWLTYAETGDRLRAAELYQQALVLARQIPDRRREASLLSNLGTILLAMSDLEGAIANQEQALTIFTNFDDLRSASMVLNALGNAYLAGGDLDQALTLYRRAVDVASQKIGAQKQPAVGISVCCLVNRVTSRTRLVFCGVP